MWLPVLTGTAGMGCFLTGIRLLTRGLEGLAHRHLRSWLLKATGTPARGAVTGLVLTVMVQSSGAITVIIVGLGAAGLMDTGRAIGVILGANIGSTFTAQIIALEPGNLGLPIAAAGSLAAWLCRGRWRSAGLAMMGLGLLFLGVNLMSSAAGMPRFREIIAGFLARTGSHPMAGILAGTLFSALFQSSSLVVGMVISLGSQSMLNLPDAIALVLGSNIGTCATAWLASINNGLEARRVAMAHIILNIAGVLLFYPIIDPFAAMIASTSPLLSRQIATAHTFFNTATSLAVLPWAYSFGRVVCRLVPGRRWD